MESADVVVAGAGPAGAFAALLLARRRPDLRVVLLDAQATPGRKPCGEYLAPRGVDRLVRAGLLPRLLADGARPLARTAITGAAGGFAVPFEALGGTGGLGVRRERLDRALQEAAAAAGAGLARGTRLVDLQHADGGWALQVEQDGVRRPLRARLLVGADGRHGIVRRRAGLDAPPRRRRLALACRARGIAHGDAVEMHLGPLGQVGVCPLGDGEVNLNLLLAGPSTPLLRRLPPERLLRAALRGTPSLTDRCGAVVIDGVLATGNLPQRCTRVVADGLCLVGDAAGFCDPFTGEGMSLALCGAEALAEALIPVDFARPLTATVLAPYVRGWAVAVGRRHRLGALLQPLLARRVIAERTAAALARLGPLARALVADAAAAR